MIFIVVRSFCSELIGPENPDEFSHLIASEIAAPPSLPHSSAINSLPNSSLTANTNSPISPNRDTIVASSRDSLWDEQALRDGFVTVQEIKSKLRVANELRQRHSQSLMIARDSAVSGTSTFNPLRHSLSLFPPNPSQTTHASFSGYGSSTASLSSGRKSLSVFGTVQQRALHQPSSMSSGGEIQLSPKNVNLLANNHLENRDNTPPPPHSSA